MSKDNQLVAVITGSSRGIGRGIAKVLGERGATAELKNLRTVIPFPALFMKWRKKSTSSVAKE
jgi:hypothetical protein